MAKFNSRVSIFQITDTGSTLRDISSYVERVEGLPGPRDLNPVTALGDTGVKSIAGLENVEFSVDLIWDDTATTGPDAVIGPLRTDDTARAFDYGPKGSTTGFVKYSGTLKCLEYNISSQVGEVVKATSRWQVQGVVTRGTYA